MLRLHRILRSMAAASLSIACLSCGAAHDSDEYFVFVSANLQVPYWKTAGTGFSNAASQFKVRSDFTGPQNYDPKAERDALDQAVQKKATGILLAVTDASSAQRRHRQGHRRRHSRHHPGFRRALEQAPVLHRDK